MNESINSPKKKSKLLGCFKIFIALIIVLTIIAYVREALMSDEEKAALEFERIQEQNRKDSLALEEEKGIELRTRLVRAEIKSEELLKENLKDPKSYEKIKIESGYTNDSSIVVNITYRATNSYGGYLQDKKRFVFSKNGNLESIN